MISRALTVGITFLLSSFALAGVNNRSPVPPAPSVAPNMAGAALGDEGEPSKFEPYLIKHPEDEARRVTAMDWYCCHQPDLKQLKYHTLLMVQYHPTNDYILHKNVSAFYADPAYRAEVIHRLEKQLGKGHSERDLYWILAFICDQGAIPPVRNDDPEYRARFLRYFLLPPGTVLSSKVDQTLADKAVKYYREAIKLAGKDTFYMPWYTDQFARLLLDLDRPKDAVEACKAAVGLADEISKPGLLVTYGKALRKAGDVNRAKIVLRQVRGCDYDWYKHPGCDTIRAETLLGLIALEEHDIQTANRYLLSSCRVQDDCSGVGGGFPTSLAEKLLDAGQYDSVIGWCAVILKGFPPQSGEIQKLLDRARSMQAKAKQSSPTPP